MPARIALDSPSLDTLSGNFFYALWRIEKRTGSGKYFASEMAAYPTRVPSSRRSGINTNPFIVPLLA
jgi:hypothetical protein